MSSVAITGSATGTGVISVLAPVTNTNRTLTLPDNTGTVVSTGSTAVVSQAMLATNVAGNGPAFSAYQSSVQTLSSATFTKVQFQTEEYDTNSNFDSTTNYRFTPTISGYYQITGAISLGATASRILVSIYKNGSEYKRAVDTGSVANTASATSLVFFNGSTDYVELYAYSTIGQVLQAVSSLTWINGAMVRSA